jgi:hypothetical protein
MLRIFAAAALALAVLSGCAGERALVYCALVDHDVNRRCH